MNDTETKQIYIAKRSGRKATFNINKLAKAIQLASKETSCELSNVEANVHANAIVSTLIVDNDTITSDEIKNKTAEYLTLFGRSDIVAAIENYDCNRHSWIKNLKVHDNNSKKTVDVTDQSLLLVNSDTDGDSSVWNREKVIKKLLSNLAIDDDFACSVAKDVEDKLFKSGIASVSSGLVRELVNNSLRQHGFHDTIKNLSLYTVSREFIESLMFTKSDENSNVVSNNPEAVNQAIAELVLKRWALDTIFDNEIKKAHETGAIHMHDLGFPDRVYCSSHSIEYIKKYGLKGLNNLNTTSKPARSASVLTGHLNTFLATMQANYAGALGIAHINILYAPLVADMDNEQMFQIAQELIFNGSQNAFSRGGQTLFLDFNIHSGVPEYLKNVPAVGKGGMYMMTNENNELEYLVENTEKDDESGQFLMTLKDKTGNIVLKEIYDNKKKAVVYDEEISMALQERGCKIMVYGDYEKTAQQFAMALLDVWREGDANGRVFEFPKCDFHISAETFTNNEEYKVFQKACELASKNGSTYFVFDRDEVALSACCRLRTTIDDDRMLRHPESMRFCGFQNVTINIPQCAYKAARKGNKTLKGLFDEIDKMFELAVKAHLQKKKAVEKLMDKPGKPLWQIGKMANDGVPYVDLEKATYIIGIIGVNDAVKFLMDTEMHEDEKALEMGLEVVAHMYLKAKDYGKIHNLKFTLEETPAESAARRLAKADLVFFANEAQNIVKGASEDVAYYTNSVHLSAEAQVNLVERIVKQGNFHCMIESGAITHAFIGESEPNAQAIEELVKDVFFNTQTAQITISPEFTYCNNCNYKGRGLKSKCPECGSEDVEGETRVVGYFSKVKNWNKSKRLGELKARQQGNYCVG